MGEDNNPTLFPVKYKRVKKTYTIREDVAKDFIDNSINENMSSIVEKLLKGYLASRGFEKYKVV
ncbi:MAG: hypothetical protein COB61_005815 [Thiotrichales bacterium]|nr:hypothetical protein [Thiotrichales bacterium]